jgi:hydroxyacyl-ACP dehydratase HTD2-like protein with hotdog domain
MYYKTSQFTINNMDDIHGRSVLLCYLTIFERQRHAAAHHRFREDPDVDYRKPPLHGKPHLHFLHRPIFYAAGE